MQLCVRKKLKCTTLAIETSLRLLEEPPPQAREGATFASDLRSGEAVQVYRASGVSATPSTREGLTG